ncbi:DUF1902 domain-containing protein [Lentilitoribacter sp. Alg239-R112]|uniref:DUF1902 domain-containing protein n=1 Tax=Lentilitoribacter sp. Alg239-R112 TaxID=2305987 RepID=UPI0013A6C40D|nr:DUF1902 domain-containing protein [Lentilitoribacter sp. Alg239-R112]
MTTRTFYVRALRDEEANVFYSESNINGLHIEADTIEEFEALMNEHARDLIMANHMPNELVVNNPIKDLIPSILWQRPENIAMA